MTKIILIISILLSTSLTFSQTVKMEEYIITIKKGEVVKEKKQPYWIIPTTLINNSNDTLRYYSMSCSWQDFYSTNNTNLKIETAICDKNIPTILTLAPGQTREVEIKLLISPTIEAPEIKFKIGFILMIATNNKKPSDFDYKEEQKNKKVIWSNTVLM